KKSIAVTNHNKSGLIIPNDIAINENNAIKTKTDKFNQEINKNDKFTNYQTEQLSKSHQRNIKDEEELLDKLPELPPDLNNSVNQTSQIKLQLLNQELTVPSDLDFKPKQTENQHQLLQIS